jgi:hypothetical protein
MVLARELNSILTSGDFYVPKCGCNKRKYALNSYSDYAESAFFVSRSRSFVLACDGRPSSTVLRENLTRKTLKVNVFNNIITLKFLWAPIFFSEPFIFQLNSIDRNCLLLPAVIINSCGVYV